MLAITRKWGQRVFLRCKGVEFEILVNRQSPGQVRICIQAPREVEVSRDGLFTAQKPAEVEPKENE